MSKYDALLETLIIDGVNVTHFGDTICEVSFTGDWTETRAGRKGDCVTDAKYDNLLQIRTTILPTSTQLAQWDVWAKSRNPHNIQYANKNTNEYYVSSSAYIQNTGSRNGNADREFTITCEEFSS
jgi:hypothetical protein